MWSRGAASPVFIARHHPGGAVIYRIEWLLVGLASSESDREVRGASRRPLGRRRRQFRWPSSSARVTERALFSVDHLAARYQRLIIRVRLLSARHSRGPRVIPALSNSGPNKQPPASGRHCVRSDRRYLMSAAAARTRTIMRRSHRRPAAHMIPPIPSIIDRSFCR